MLVTSKEILTAYTKNNLGVGLFDTGAVIVSPESLLDLVETIVKQEREDAFKEVLKACNVNTLSMWEDK